MNARQLFRGMQSLQVERHGGVHASKAPGRFGTEETYRHFIHVGSPSAVEMLLNNGSRKPFETALNTDVARPPRTVPMRLMRTALNWSPKLWTNGGNIVSLQGQDCPVR